jgi:hypothetical protein
MPLPKKVSSVWLGLLVLFLSAPNGFASKEHPYIRPIPGFTLYDSEFKKFASFTFKIEEQDGTVTDSVGQRAYNRQLSERRAMTVRSFLSLYGIDPERMTVRGFGAERPVADNRTGGSGSEPESGAEEALMRTMRRRVGDTSG